MFDRRQCKAVAKDLMRANWGPSVVVGLIVTFLAAGTGFFVNVDSQGWGKLIPADLWAAVSFILPAVSVANALYVIFVGNVISVGGGGWFLRSAKGEKPSIARAFDGFRIYGSAVTTSLLAAVFTFLWALLFIIPGIVKSYSYSMAKYIIYENPSLSARQALDLSQKITKGRKWDLFVLDLSWLGWALLSVLTLGVLDILYVAPYVHQTEAAVYNTMKYNSIQEGRVSPADFEPAAPFADDQAR